LTLSGNNLTIAQSLTNQGSLTVNSGHVLSLQTTSGNSLVNSGTITNDGTIQVGN